MSLADMWCQEGKAKRLAETTILLLTQKFGKVPSDMKERITKMDTDSLKILFINIFNFTAIDAAKYYLQ